MVSNESCKLLVCLSMCDCLVYIRYYTAQKMKFSIKDFFIKYDHMVTFAEEILNGKHYFLCRANELKTLLVHHIF